MNSDSEQILKSFLDNLWRISNKEYQKRIWIEGRGPEWHDFDEAVCDFFDDGDSIIEKYKDFKITDIQRQLLVHFRDVFEVFSDTHSWAPTFIDTPEWETIMRMAKEVLKAFNYKQED